MPNSRRSFTNFAWRKWFIRISQTWSSSPQWDIRICSPANASRTKWYRILICLFSSLVACFFAGLVDFELSGEDWNQFGIFRTDYLTEKIGELNGFLRSGTERKIFCFTRRQGDTSLLLETPWDRTIRHNEDKTSGWFAGWVTACLVGVAVADNQRNGRGPEINTKIHGSLWAAMHSPHCFPVTHPRSFAVLRKSSDSKLKAWTTAYH